MKKPNYKHPAVAETLGEGLSSAFKVKESIKPSTVQAGTRNLPKQLSQLNDDMRKKVSSIVRESIPNLKKASLQEVIGAVTSALKEVVYPVEGIIDTDEAFYRRLTQQERDLTPLTQQRQIKIAYWLYLTNPVAYAMMETKKDFIIGDGIRYKATNLKVQEVLDRFWYHPTNNLPQWQQTITLEMNLYGEFCVPVYTNPIDGMVELGYADPMNISAIEYNPSNCKDLWNVVVSMRGRPKKRLKIIREDMNPHSATFKYMAGECFYFAVNKVTNAVRGHSDLLTALDWLDGYDQFIFQQMDRGNFLNMFIWDVLLEGYQQDQIDAWVKKAKVPKPGSIRAHNEKVKWNVVTPDLQSGEAEMQAKLVRGQIFCGQRMPFYWFSEAGDMGRAVALEASSPTYRMLRSRQDYVKHMFEAMFDFVIDQAIIAKTLPKDVERDFVVLMPPLTERNTAQISSSVATISSALVVAEQAQWISKSQAQQVFLFLLEDLGVEFPKPDKDSVLSAGDKEVRVTVTPDNPETETKKASNKAPLLLTNDSARKTSAEKNVQRSADKSQSELMRSLRIASSLDVCGGEFDKVGFETRKRMRGLMQELVQLSENLKDGGSHGEEIAQEVGGKTGQAGSKDGNGDGSKGGN